MVLLLRGSTMEIEDREEAFMFIHSWMEENRELLSLIAEGESRPQFSGSKLEFELGHLENYWEAVMEEIQEEEDCEEKEKQISKMVNLKADLEALSSEAEKLLKEIQESSTVTEAEQVDLESENEVEIKESDIVLGVDGVLRIEDHIGSKEEHQIHPYEEFEKDEGEEIGDLMKMMKDGRTQQDLVLGVEFEEEAWAGKLELQEKRSVTDAGLIPEPLGPPPWSKEKKEADDKMAEGDSGIDLLPVKNRAIDGLILCKEERERDFEKMVLKAAREMQSTNAVWVLGLNVDKKFEPVFILVMGLDKLGSEMESVSIQMEGSDQGPPTWISSEFNCSKKNGLDLEIISPLSWLNLCIDLREELGWKHGPALQPIKHGPTNVVEIRGTTSTIHWRATGYLFRLQPPDRASKRLSDNNCEGRSSSPPPPPKPSPSILFSLTPQIGQQNSELSLFQPHREAPADSFSTVFIVINATGSSHFWLCQRKDSAGNDPGPKYERFKLPPPQPPDFHPIRSTNIPFLSGLLLNAPELNFRYNLGDKAILRGVKINEVRGRNSYLNEQQRTTKQGELVLEVKPLSPPPWSWQLQQDERELQLNMMKARAEFVRVVTNANELRLRDSSIQELVWGIKTEISRISAALCASKCVDMRLMMQLQQGVAMLVMDDEVERRRMQLKQRGLEEDDLQTEREHMILALLVFEDVLCRIRDGFQQSGKENPQGNGSQNVFFHLLRPPEFTEEESGHPSYRVINQAPISEVGLAAAHQPVLIASGNQREVDIKSKKKVFAYVKKGIWRELIFHAFTMGELKNPKSASLDSYGDPYVDISEARVAAYQIHRKTGLLSGRRGSSSHDLGEYASRIRRHKISSRIHLLLLARGLHC